MATYDGNGEKFKYQPSSPNHQVTGRNSWPSYFNPPGNGGLPLKDEIFFGTGQAQAHIFITNTQSGQANALILQTSNAFAQAQSWIKSTVLVYSQAQGTIPSSGTITRVYAQSTAWIAVRIVYDTFSRITSGNYGTPDVGPNYANTFYTNYAESAADGSVLVLPGTEDYDSLTGDSPVDVRDAMGVLDFKISDLTESVVVRIGLRNNVDNFFNVVGYVYHSMDDGYTLELFASDYDGIYNDYNSEPFSLSLDTWYTIKLLAHKRDLRLKVWERGTQEPEWQNVILNGVTILPAGTAFLEASVGTDGTYTFNQYFDNWAVYKLSEYDTEEFFGQAQAFINTGFIKSAQAMPRIKVYNYYANVIYADSPDAYYPLSDRLESSSAYQEKVFDNVGVYHMTRNNGGSGYGPVGGYVGIPGTYGDESALSRTNNGSYKDHYLSRYSLSIPLSGTTNWALEAWVYFTDIPASRVATAILTVGSTSYKNSGAYSLILESADPARFGIAVGQGGSIEQPAYETYNPDVSTGKWYHLVATRGTGDLKLYVNGVLVTQTAPVITYHNFVDTIFINANETTSAVATYRIDEVALYSREMGQDEAFEHFRAGYMLGQSYGQAQAVTIGPTAYGQAQAFIFASKYANGQSRASIMKRIVYDTFTRSTSLGDPVGTPDEGPDWTEDSGGSGLQIDGSKLTSTGSFAITNQPGGIGWLAVMSRIEITPTATPNYIYVYFLGGPATGAYYSSPNFGAVSNQGTSTNSFTVNSGTTYVIKALAIYTSGTSGDLYTKMWEKGTVEPNWLVTHFFTGSPLFAKIQILTGQASDVDNVELFAVRYYQYTRSAQARAQILKGGLASGQAQARIHEFRGYGQAQGYIKILDIRYVGQAQAFIIQHRRRTGQSMAMIETATRIYSQSAAYINATKGSGQAQALIENHKKSAQSVAYIKAKGIFYGQAQGKIIVGIFSGQANANIESVKFGFANASGWIITKLVYGQAQGFLNYGRAFGNSKAWIIKPQPTGQSMARIFAHLTVNSGNALAKIFAKTVEGHSGQAQSMVKMPAMGQSAALIGSERYLVRYNGYDLPGYAQQESLDSIENIFSSSASYVDGNLSEYVGLQNKQISLGMKVAGDSYLDVKEQVQKAFTIVRTKKGFTKLYIQHYDKYYLALTTRASTSKEVTESMRTLSYEVEFEAKPWLIRESVFTISGVGTISTDAIGRTLDSGGWTPATIKVTGTNVTISGYNYLGYQTGYISISGSVTGLMIDTESYTATINGENMNQVMYTPNYQMYIGPGKTTFVTTGATEMEISYQDRWYL